SITGPPTTPGVASGIRRSRSSRRSGCARGSRCSRARPSFSMPARIEPRWGWLLASFARREVLNRYAGSVTGLAWTLLHPLAQLAIFAFVFSHIFRIGVPAGYSNVSYVTFVAVALWPWIMFSEGLQRAMLSIAGNAGLIRK